MKLSNCEIRPGVVVTADDPKKMGRIKAVVPGWFNNASMHEEDMFWIAPFTSGSGYQRVSKCIEGQKYGYCMIPQMNMNIIILQCGKQTSIPLLLNKILTMMY